MPARIDLGGQRFGRLTVVGFSARRDAAGNVHWDCACDCGIRKPVAGRLLRNGDVRSCGCYQREIAGKIFQKNLAGHRFGRFVVLHRMPSGRDRGARWMCRCDCGATKEVRQLSLIQGTSKSCGCVNVGQRPLRRDLTGKRFGRLIVLSLARRMLRHDAVWRCRCSCGTEKEIVGRSLTYGSTTSCGCYNREISTTHGLSQTREYRRAEARWREISKQKRTPAWANRSAIREFYRRRPVGLHVDHIIPLHHELVCGFHVEHNLQYLPAIANLRKCNKFIPIIGGA